MDSGEVGFALNFGHVVEELNLDVRQEKGGLKYVDWAPEGEEEAFAVVDAILFNKCESTAL